MTARLLLALLVLASPAAASEWIVSRGGGGHFKDLQVAIDTVSPGDTLLIKGTQRGRAKHYGGPPPITVTKSLTIRGMGPDSAIVGGSRDQYGDETALVIDAGSVSSVVIEGLLVQGGRVEAWINNACDGIRVVSCGSLAIARCTVLAGSNFLTNPSESFPETCEGIDARGARHLVVRDSTIKGGAGCFAWGGWPSPPYPSEGGAGILLGGASALIDHCDVQGGNGGDCVLSIPFNHFPRIWPPDIEGANGGAGILVGACPLVMVLGGTQAGGSRGEYLFDWNDPDTWLGRLGFKPGIDGLAIDGDARLGTG